MIKFLIQRPIAVLMAFTACFIIGLVTYNTLPISLLPDIAIPEITIQVSAANTSARELENTIVKPLRGQLIQVSTLKDIHSESRDGGGMIRLSFEFGTNTDLAFIEVNEKIDAAMNYLPKDTERPKVIKASATDIPVFYLNLTLKNDSAYSTIGQHSFLDLCEFAESVIKRRIEQLEEVAMVDVTGLVERQVQIVPDEDKLAMMGFSIEDIESALAANNVEPGSMFYDQAFSVTVGLMVSYFTGIMLLPVLYLLVYRTGIHARKWKWLSFKFNNPIKDHTLDRFYDAGVDWVFRHKTFSVLFCVVSIPLCVFFFFFIDKQRMPDIEENELIARIEWNENIHVDENRRRVDELFRDLKEQVLEYTASVGRQDFLLNRERELSSSEAELYFRTETSEIIAPLQQEIYHKLKERYPLSVISFSPPETVFEKLFVTGEPDIIAEFYTRNKAKAPEAETIRSVELELARRTGIAPTGIAFENQLNLSINKEKLLLYRVAYNELYRVLKTAFRENSVTMLHSYQQYLPINVAGSEKTVNEILQETLIQTEPDSKGDREYIPLRELVTVTPAEDLKSITAGRNGEYVPFDFYGVQDGNKLIKEVKQTAEDMKDWDTGFSGSFFSNSEMLDELVIILFISLLLMYFILAAQFESFLQPLLVLAEIPIDLAFALLLLWICGHTLNLMSAIGLIVTCGIVINDSILKLDAINELRKAGVPLLEAIHEAGRRRLRPIIMTSLTTIFAMVPLLFSSDMGSELQKPLSIAMIGTMSIGTAVSLFIIPLLYWFIYRNKKISNS